MAAAPALVSSDLFGHRHKASEEDEEEGGEEEEEGGELSIARLRVLLPRSQSSGSGPDALLPHLGHECGGECGVECGHEWGVECGGECGGECGVECGGECGVECGHEAVGSRKRKRKRTRENSVFVTLSHKVRTAVEDVGLQLWKGALLLADYLLHCHSDKQALLCGRTIVELGAGTGFLGVILSLLPCKTVYLTDMSEHIARLIERNISTNSHLVSSISSISCPLEQDRRIRVLDWRDDDDDDNDGGGDVGPCRAAYSNPSSVTSHCSTPPRNPWAWTANDTECLATQEVLWLAADVIYDDEVTEYFFRFLSRAMRPGEHLLLALEKRFNFEMDSLSLVAHGYELFRRFINVPLDTHENSDVTALNAVAVCTRDCFTSAPKEKHMEVSEKVVFRGKLVSLEFPQYVTGYERTRELELWDIVCELL
jgi:predicted nicotinamide N-methyase